MKENALIKPINEEINEDKNEWILCGSDDVCDDCVGVCDPTYH
ncbi:MULTISPECIES: hypothetical protein [Paenibacillus]|nr:MULTISPECIES: hypothetical protein [Paenibacillus]